MASALPALYFMNLRGDILIQRVYRDEIDRNMAEVFRQRILLAKDTNWQRENPIKTLGSVTYMYMRCNNVILLVASKDNANAMLTFRFMSSVVNLLKAYGGVFTEDSIKSNFGLIYELLDEILDHGFPQITEPQVMKSYIFQKAYKSEEQLQQQAMQSASATLQVTGAVSWRSGNERHRKNVIKLDVVEQVNMIMSQEGSILKCDVNGKIIMHCQLSGMPELRLGLSERLDDVTLHQCVNLGRFNAERTVNFVPPEGEFTLIQYRSQDNLQLPFKMTSLVKEVGRTRLQVSVRVVGKFNQKLFAQNVAIHIPVPDQTARAEIQVSQGRAKYDAVKHSLVWKMRRFTGSTEQNLMADVILVSTTKDRKQWSRPPISMHFILPMYSASGLRVQYLKVWEKSGYQTEKWVRKICKSGDYQFRM